MKSGSRAKQGENELQVETAVRKMDRVSSVRHDGTSRHDTSREAGRGGTE